MQFCKLFFKRNQNIATCGLFAFSGVKGITQEQIKLAVNKIKILGLYNETRGTHSCGIFINNIITKGIDQNRLFSSFIVNNNLEYPKDNDVIIGHTRQASRGAQNLENTHPFLIDNELCGIHNGTIDNIWQLCNEYKIEHIGENIMTSDSKALFTIIQRTGNLEVLNKYKGGAALIWTTLANSNSMFIYHGSSLKSRLSTALSEEERPLYFMKTEEGIYLSSLESSLNAIKDEEDQKVECVPHNRVMKITNGKFTTYRFVVDRGDCNLPYVAPISQKNVNYQNSHVSKTYTPQAINSSFQDTLKIEPTIWREKKPERVFKDNRNYIYFHKGRYYNDGGSLCSGLVCVKKGNIIIPYLDAALDQKYYFFEGIMMKSSKVYDELLEMLNRDSATVRNPANNFALIMSPYSRYPVTNLPSDSTKCSAYGRYAWYLDNKRALEGFTPKFGGRNYVIKSGLLQEISGANRRDQDVLFKSFNDSTSDNLKLVSQDVEEEEVNIQQLRLPFRKDPNISEESENETLKFNYILDTVFKDKVELINDFREYHFSAIHSFIGSLLREKHNFPIDDEEICSHFDIFVEDAIREGKTLRMIMNCDKDDSLDILMEITKKNWENSITDASIDFSLINHEFQEDNKQTDFYNIEDVDEIIEEDIKQQHQREEVEDKMEDALDIMRELQQSAEQLDACEDQMGKDIANHLLRAVDNIKHNITESIEENSGSQILLQKIHSLN